MLRNVALQESVQEQPGELLTMPPTQLRHIRANDLTGRRFGRLVVLAPTEKRIDCGCIVWLCQCDCGKLVEISGRRLVRGKVRSCGCLSNPEPKDYVGKKFGRLTVIGYAGRKRKKMKNSAATINYWKCRCECGNEVTVAQPELQTGDTLSCGCLQKERVKDMLQLVDGTSVTLLERTHNKVRRTNTSGCTGVSQTKDGKWEAYINFKKKRYYLGRYADKKDAIKARRRGEEMHKEFLEWYYKEFQSE